MLKKNQICIGRKPVEEALLSGTTLEKIFIQRGSSGSTLPEIQKLAQKAQVPVAYVPKEKLNRFTNLRHQGVVAILSSIKYYKIEDIIDHCFSEGRDPLILILDGVTDVGNFGAICRTALGLSVDAIITPQSKSAAVNETAIKASAGAIHHIKICREFDLEHTINYLKNTGLTLLSLDGKGDKMIGEMGDIGPVAVLVGDEGKGVSKKLLELSTDVCKIPMDDRLESYNVSVATAIMLYEINRLRG